MKDNKFYKVTGENREKFIRILKVLNRFYESTNEGKGKDLNNRIELSNSDISEFEIQKFEKYKFICSGKIGEKKTEWIHIDGIQEERDLIKAEDHPVFHIECLSDIYSNIIKEQVA
jgi:sarcosine oxidase delta subunit